MGICLAGRGTGHPDELFHRWTAICGDRGRGAWEAKDKDGGLPDGLCPAGYKGEIGTGDLQNERLQTSKPQISPPVNNSLKKKQFLLDSWRYFANFAFLN